MIKTEHNLISHIGRNNLIIVWVPPEAHIFSNICNISVNSLSS